MVKEIMSLLSLQLMYSYFNELTLYAGVLYMQPSWYNLSSWPHSDITSLGRSVTCTFLASPFFTAEMLLGQVSTTYLPTLCSNLVPKMITGSSTKDLTASCTEAFGC